MLDESAHLTNITTKSSGEGIVCVRGFFFKIFEITDRGWPLACKASVTCLISSDFSCCALEVGSATY